MSTINSGLIGNICNKAKRACFSKLHFAKRVAIEQGNNLKAKRLLCSQIGIKVDDAATMRRNQAIHAATWQKIAFLFRNSCCRWCRLIVKTFEDLKSRPLQYALRRGLSTLFWKGPLGHTVLGKAVTFLKHTELMVEIIFHFDSNLHEFKSPESG